MGHKGIVLYTRASAFSRLDYINIQAGFSALLNETYCERSTTKFILKVKEQNAVKAT